MSLDALLEKLHVHPVSDCPHGEISNNCEKCYRGRPGSELRFRNLAEEDAYYTRLYEDHGGVKIIC